MRLIDADALKKKFPKNDMCDYEEFCEFIDMAPTVYGISENDITDFYPKIIRTTGEWIHDNLCLDVRCSVCNSYALERGDYPELSAYCPACGARMEVKEND